MLAGLHYRAVVLMLCAAALIAGGACARDLTADEYLAMRKSLGAYSGFSALKDAPSSYVGKTIELKGTVNGIVSCGGSTSFMLDCQGEYVCVQASSELPGCIANGNTVCILAKIGAGCTASLSDLQLVGTAYDYDVSRREQQLAPKSKAASTTSPAPAKGASATYQPSGQGRGMNLSSRAASIYDPYRRAIAGFNPKLSARQLDTITTSILAFSEHYGIDPRLVVALILAESGFRPEATSPKGAMGLCQLMPGTAKGLGVGNAYDPVQNIEASIRLIRGHLGKYGDLSLALSAYNAGGGAVKKYGGIPPYKETRNYVRKVTSIYKALCGK